MKISQNLYLNIYFISICDLNTTVTLYLRFKSETLLHYHFGFYSLPVHAGPAAPSLHPTPGTGLPGTSPHVHPSVWQLQLGPVQYIPERPSR